MPCLRGTGRAFLMVGPFYDPYLATEGVDQLLTSGRAGITKAALAEVSRLAISAEGKHQQGMETLELELQAARHMLSTVGAHRDQLVAQLAALKKAAAMPPNQSMSRQRSSRQQFADALAAGVISEERAAEILNVSVAAITRIASGRTTLASTAWRKLRDYLDGGAEGR